MSVLNGEDEANVTPQSFPMNQFDSSFLTNQGFPCLCRNYNGNTIQASLHADKRQAGRIIRPACHPHSPQGRGIGSVTPRGSPLPGDPGGDLRATLQAHLGQQRRDVVLHGLLRDAELLTDLTVREAITDQV